MGKNREKVKLITISAMLAALGYIIPFIMPKIALTPFITATPFSHVPLMLAIFISPFAAFYCIFSHDCCVFYFCS